jgi:hypothetical protein
MNVFAAEIAPSLIGAGVAVVIAAGGWIVSSRSQRTDSASALVTAALAISERHASDESECRRRLAELSDEHEKCNSRLSRIESALASRGISLA